MPAKKATKKSSPTFAEARQRLDELLEELEREAGDVDKLAARIKEASELIRLCRERLSAARQEVREVVAELAADVPATQDDEVLDEDPAFSEPDVVVPDADEERDPGAGTLPF